jgi:hypothetical protein
VTPFAILIRMIYDPMNCLVMKIPSFSVLLSAPSATNILWMLTSPIPNEYGESTATDGGTAILGVEVLDEPGAPEPGSRRKTCGVDDEVDTAECCVHVIV